MPHFVNHAKNYYISTNYKVLYSLLYHQPSLEVAKKRKFEFQSYLKRFLFCGWMRHFLLVRDPYRRAVSFFKDKFRQEPLHRWLKYDELQSCQQIFCPHLNIYPADSPAEIRNKLLDVSFGQFVHLLPQLYLLDRHLHPQVKLSAISFRGIHTGSIKFDRILKIESSDDMTYLQDELAIDLSKKYNATHNIQLSNPWEPNLLIIINRLYQADFQTFDYEMRKA